MPTFLDPINSQGEKQATPSIFLIQYSVSLWKIMSLSYGHSCTEVKSVTLATSGSDFNINAVLKITDSLAQSQNLQILTDRMSQLAAH